MGFKNTFEIITKDIQELEKMVANFQNYSRIPKIEIDLALRKMQNLYDLLLMIREHEEEYTDEKSVDAPMVQNTKLPDQPEVSREPVKEAGYAPKDKFEYIPEEKIPVVQEKPVPSETVQAPQSKPESKPILQEPSEAAQPKEKVLGEKFPGKEYLNEKIGGTKTLKDVTSKIQSTPIRSIGGSMGLNDKFFFIRELFYGNAENFNQAIKILDQMQNFNHAYNYLLGNFEWDMDSESVQQLLSLVRRKFISSGNE